jgi:hypothetical protein
MRHAVPTSRFRSRDRRDGPLPRRRIDRRQQLCLDLRTQRLALRRRYDARLLAAR